jgi:hypothetical protein
LNILTEDEAAAARSSKGLEPYEGRELLAECSESEKEVLTGNRKEKCVKRIREPITLDDDVINERRGLENAAQEVQTSCVLEHSTHIQRLGFPSIPRNPLFQCLIDK